MSKDLYIYDSQNGGRAANCNLSSPSPLQNNCWVDLQSKFYISTELKTPPLECTSGLVDSDNPIARLHPAGLVQIFGTIPQAMGAVATFS